MKIGKKVELEIEKMASDGRGISHFDGVVVFVHGAVEGERVIAEIYTIHKTYLTAGVVKTLSPSPFRQESFCENSGACGGCPLSHIKYEKQLEIKKQTVADALSRIGGLDLSGVHISNTKGMETPYRYRNKMVFPIGTQKGKSVGGFYAPKSHDIVPLTDCFSGEKASSVAMGVVTEFLNRENILPYDEKSEKGTVRRVFVRTGYHTKELMVVISSFTEKIKNIDKLIAVLKAADFGGYTLKSIILNINRKKNNLVLGDKNITLFGNGEIKDTLMGLEFKISPHSFFQINPLQTEVLYKTAIDLADVDETKTVFDIYCGIGTITLFAAKRAKSVTGVEIVEKAIADAKNNAKSNNIENASFYCGAAEDVVPKLVEDGNRPDIVILDPPRKGSDEKTLSAILTASPEKIVYVSCNPSTLARDLKFLCGNGYTLKQVVPVDMFPNTEHVETVVMLSQLKPDDVVQVELNAEDLALTSAEAKATYEEIKTYVKRAFGFKVSSLYIAQVKQKMGLPMGKNYNVSKKGTRVPLCPPEKEEAILEALKHYKMI